MGWLQTRMDDQGVFHTIKDLKSHANECFDNFPEDLQVMIKDLDKM